MYTFIKMLAKSIYYAIPLTFSFMYLFGIMPYQLAGESIGVNPIYTVIGIPSTFLILWFMYRHMEEAKEIKRKAEDR